MVRPVIQNIFRNLKGYKLLIKFLQINEEFFIQNRKKVPLAREEDLNSERKEEELILINKIDHMFEGIFSLLNLFTKYNKQNLK